MNYLLEFWVLAPLEEKLLKIPVVMYISNLSRETTTAKTVQSYKEGLVVAFCDCSSKLTKKNKNDVVFEMKMAWKALKRF